MEQFNNLLQAIEGEDRAARKESVGMNEQAVRNALHIMNGDKITGLYEIWEEV